VAPVIFPLSLRVAQSASRTAARQTPRFSTVSSLLKDGKSAVAEMGFGMTEHHKHLVVLESTPDIHNVIVRTFCSCTA
jgi:hypothetical protein